MRSLPRNIIRYALFLTLALLMRFAGTAAAQTPSAAFSVDTAEISAGPIGNRAGCVNVWRCQTLSPPTGQDRADGADLTPFVEWVEFMQATGSSPDRDLFQDPNNAAVLDDYDFAPLLDACAAVLSLGARPHIKLSVPTKYSSNRNLGDFKTNVFPPDDYEVYGAFVRALARALAERFGLDEVRRWRFGVLTEFENPGWFRAESGTPEDSREAYFKLYDYSADALCAELGPDICIGAHAMACSEGLWDERDLLNHCPRPRGRGRARQSVLRRGRGTDPLRASFRRGGGRPASAGGRTDVSGGVRRAAFQADARCRYRLLLLVELFHRRALSRNTDPELLRRAALFGVPQFPSGSSRTGRGRGGAGRDRT